jgi:hypothetical protein
LGKSYISGKGGTVIELLRLAIDIILSNKVSVSQEKRAKEGNV